MLALRALTAPELRDYVHSIALYKSELQLLTSCCLDGEAAQHFRRWLSHEEGQRSNILSYLHKHSRKHSLPYSLCGILFPTNFFQPLVNHTVSSAYLRSSLLHSSRRMWLITDHAVSRIWALTERSLSLDRWWEIFSEQAPERPHSSGLVQIGKVTLILENQVCIGTYI